LPGGQNKDPTVWLDGARPANTCISPSFLGNVPAQLHSLPTPKIHLQEKKLAKFGKITFFILKIRERV